MSDRPGINPWLPVERTYRVTGYDQFGRERDQTMICKILPSFYFWLGADAYTEPRLISSIVPASE